MVGIPRGTRDFSPSEAISLKELTDVIENVFKRFGFYPILTPCIENLDVLNAKAYGDEATKEIYVVSDEKAGLRFDLTVPLARYMSMNKDVPLPFKRYDIGKAWRKDEPQKMRNREFMQADVDIVGGSEIICDAEVIAAVATALEALGITDYNVLINSRIILNELLTALGVPKDKTVGAIRSIDKLVKMGKEVVTKELVAMKIDERKAEDVINFLEQEGSNETLLDKVKVTAPGAGAETGRVYDLLQLLKSYNLGGKFMFDPSLARGLDYYTSFVWEFVVFIDGKRAPTIAAGGRYDNLVSVYSKQGQPATGISLGVSRLFDVLQSKSTKKTYAQVFVAFIGKENMQYALDTANFMRSKGVFVDANLTSRSISKQLEYANALNIKYVAVIGAKENEAKKVKLKNMLTGEEQMIAPDDAVKIILK